ncbi:hypothetical protein E2F43_18295 [Seongchinamella unica]|uniref:Uncharacterized protein n=1 Tax=Seongchinamella unica TaxID=2547392 RepID=A0A4V2ZWV6_9GAMM|nr:hypothetical protein [Seongchinamella unica]TDG11662.1 hypothetical protein E2F43_18295 [Seongchinamella unica]
MSEIQPSDALVSFIVLGFIIGAVWALRKAIAHLLIFGIAVLFILTPLTQPDINSWWSLIGVLLIIGQLGMAKEALIDKPAAEKASKELDDKAKKAIIEMNEARKNQSNGA